MNIRKGLTVSLSCKSCATDDSDFIAIYHYFYHATVTKCYVIFSNYYFIQTILQLYIYYFVVFIVSPVCCLCFLLMYIRSCLRLSEQRSYTFYHCVIFHYFNHVACVIYVSNVVEIHQCKSCRLSITSNSGISEMRKCTMLNLHTNISNIVII